MIVSGQASCLPMSTVAMSAVIILDMIDMINKIEKKKMI